MEDRNFVVYAHYTVDTDELFYIGEGRPDRAKRKNHRNRYWNFKVAKHGFKVVIVKDNLTKSEAESFEEQLIKEELEKGTKLTNMCIGPMFKNHWLVGRPKEDHPMYGKTFDAPWIAESNRRRVGKSRNISNEAREALIARNKSGNYRRSYQKVCCVETGQVFDSVKAASEWAGITSSQISKALTDPNRKSAGYHWKRIGERS